MEDVPWTLYLSAVGTGLIFGYVAQRGGFCFTRALSAAVLSRDLRLLRAGVLALIVATVGVQLLATLGLVDLPLRPLRWVANIVGGLFFGAGMILGGGDTASTWYRVGEGAIGAWVVLLGFALGATTSGLGILLPLRTLLQRPTITIGDDGVPTLANVFGLSPWIIVAVLAVAGAVWLARGARGAEGDRWSWPVTGVAVGVVIAGAWWTSAIGDRPVGIALAVSTGHLLTYPLVGYPNRVTWSMLSTLGVPIGALVAAWTTGRFGWTLPAGSSLVRIFGGGLLMGASAIVADGCNITQGLTNAVTLSLSSLLTLLAMIAGASLTLRLLHTHQP